MSYLLQFTECIDQCAKFVSGHGLRTAGNRPHTTSIHILDDYSLLNVFYLYRPHISGEDENVVTHIKSGGQWDNGHWWFKLTHVCQRWRDLILGSASYLGLCLVCTNGTPVADMLIHSPPLPLVIDYQCLDGDLNEEDEEDILLALEQRELVRYIRLIIPVWNAHKLVAAISEEYPTLEYLILTHPTGANTALIDPTLQAPRLRHLAQFGGDFPMSLISVGRTLVTLYLLDIHSLGILPADLFQHLSFMPQLEKLIYLGHPVRYAEIRTPITTRITLPNLRSFAVRGASAYLEELFCHITTPRLEKLHIIFFLQRTFSVPWLLQFINTTKDFGFNRAKFEFSDDQVRVEIYPFQAETAAFSITVKCRRLDQQVIAVAQIFNELSQMLSMVEHLTVELRDSTDRTHNRHNEVDRSKWQNLLRAFKNVKTLRIGSGLIVELSRCLRLEDGELPLGVLPELQELTYSSDVRRPRASFAHLYAWCAVMVLVLWLDVVSGLW